jgi:integrase
MQVVRDAIQARGFSQAVSERVSTRATKQSTQKLYESKWNKFCDWCSERGQDPCTASPQTVADFLLYLFDDCGFYASTIEVYRSAISQTFHALQLEDVGTHPVVSNLIKSFKRDRPVMVNQFPQWNLVYVLNTLTRAPYEPLKDASMMHLTIKTVFLLLLASGRRRGEIHALDATRCQWSEDHAQVLLYPVPGFIPKVPDAAEGRPRFQPICIKALTNLVGNDRGNPDRTLCPLRALSCYLAKTQGIRTSRRRLFLPTQSSRGTEICANTVSGWVKKVIRHAYDEVPEELEQMHNLRTHEIRAIASSLAKQANVPMADIMRTCSWAGHNTFTHYYLRDMSTILGDLHVLGPIMVAGAIIHGN